MINSSSYNPKLSSTAFGTKTISLWSSVILIINNDMGPIMLILPLLFQESGYLTVIIGLILLYLISTISCLYIASATQRYEIIEILPED